MISNGKLVMFTPLVLGLSIPTRSNAERRGHLSLRGEMSMQGMCEEQVILAGALVDVGIVDIGGE
jgi:hypothetical protein